MNVKNESRLLDILDNKGVKKNKKIRMGIKFLPDRLKFQFSRWCITHCGAERMYTRHWETSMEHYFEYEQHLEDAMSLDEIAYETTCCAAYLSNEEEKTRNEQIEKLKELITEIKTMKKVIIGSLIILFGSLSVVFATNTDKIIKTAYMDLNIKGGDYTINTQKERLKLGVRGVYGDIEMKHERISNNRYCGFYLRTKKTDMTEGSGLYEILDNISAEIYIDETKNINEQNLRKTLYDLLEMDILKLFMNWRFKKWRYEDVTVGVGIDFNTSYTRTNLEYITNLRNYNRVRLQLDKKLIYKDTYVAPNIQYLVNHAKQYLDIGVELGMNFH